MNYTKPTVSRLIISWEQNEMRYILTNKRWCLVHPDHLTTLLEVMWVLIWSPDLWFEQLIFFTLFYDKIQKFYKYLGKLHFVVAIVLLYFTFSVCLIESVERIQEDMYILINSTKGSLRPHPHGMQSPWA
jgi:hypothetical protein